MVVMLSVAIPVPVSVECLLVEFDHKHRRDVLQAVFGFHARENRRRWPERPERSASYGAGLPLQIIWQAGAQR